MKVDMESVLPAPSEARILDFESACDITTRRV